MTETLIRPATVDDLDDILDIYNDAILNGIALWTDDPVERSDREQWFASLQSRGFPVLVAEVDGVVAGYANYGPWQSRVGYRFSVEDSVYIRAEFHGRGLGRALLTELISLARDAGMHRMIADIEAGNAVSIQLHEKLGFVTDGIVPEVGFKFGKWLDLAIMRLDL